ANNQSVDDLVSDLMDALAAARLGSEVVAGQSQGRLTLTAVGAARGQSLEIAVTPSDDPAATVLHFANGQQAGTQDSAYPLGDLTGVAKIAGLTLHDSADVDWFTFTLTAEGAANDQITLAPLQHPEP